jgi:hypothetical protein
VKEIDNDRYSIKSEWIQDGPCRGYSRANGQKRDFADERFPGILGFDRAKSRIERNLSSIPLDFYVGFLHLKRVQAVVPKDNSVATCRQECAAGSAYCLRVRPEPRDQAGLRRLQQLASGNPSAISASQIQAAFNVTQDPCRRGDIKFESGYMANIGQDVCSLQTALPSSDVTIRVPEILRGKWTSIPAVVEVVFDDPRTRANLKFSHDGLNRDWSGDIVALFSERNAVGFSVGVDSCVRADLD